MIKIRKTLPYQSTASWSKLCSLAPPWWGAPVKHPSCPQWGSSGKSLTSASVHQPSLLSLSLSGFLSQLHLWFHPGGEDPGQVGVGIGSNWTRTSEAKKNSLVVQTESCLIRILAFHRLYEPSWTIGPSTGLDWPGRPQFPFFSLETSEEQAGRSTEEGDAMKKSGLSMALVPVSARASPRPWRLSHLRTWALHRRTPEVLGLSESDGLQGQSWAELNPRSQFNVFLLFIKTKSEFVKLLIKTLASV